MLNLFRRNGRSTVVMSVISFCNKSKPASIMSLFQKILIQDIRPDLLTSSIVSTSESISVRAKLYPDCLAFSMLLFKV